MLDRVKMAWRVLRNATTPFTFEQFQEWMIGGSSDAGVVVSERSAMTVSTVYACVRLIGGAISSLPLHQYRHTPNGRERVNDNLWSLLNEQPGPMWSATAFWQYIAYSRLLMGDGYARIIRRSPLSPDVAELQPVHPLNVDPKRIGNRLVYMVYNPIDMAYEAVDQDDMLHFPSPGFDGIRSPSPVRFGLRNSVGIAIAADEYSASFFRNGAKPDFALTTPGKFSEDQAAVLRQTWASRHGGATNSHLPAILSGGLDIKELTLTAEDSQLIATRQFQVEDIARFYGVPPSMVGHTEKMTSWGSGIENMGIGFVTYTLQPHLTVIEQEVNRKFYLRKGKFVEFSVEGLLRGDSKSRSEFYTSALGGSAGSGWMTVNEVRRLENMPPIDGGDEITKWTQGAADGNQSAQAAGQ